MDESILATAAREYPGATTHEDLDSMLAATDLDLLSICTSHRSHAPLTVDAAASDVVGIVCEKPMATGLGEATAMLTAADQTNTKLVIGHQNRFATVHERARELVEKGAIGAPEAVTVRTTGGLINNGTHFIDLTRFILDDPAAKWCAAHVQRRTDRYERGFPAEDGCVGRVCFENGTRLTIETDTPDPLVPDANLIVRGREGIIHVDYGNDLRIVTSNGIERLAPNESRSRRLRLLDDLLDWVGENRADHRCSGEHSYATMEIMMGLYDAVRTDQIIEFPVETRANPLELMIASGDLPPTYPGRYDIRHPYASLRAD